MPTTNRRKGRKVEPQGPTPEEQARHDEAVARWDARTNKPLRSLTQDEFRQILHIIILPNGMSSQAKRRRQYLFDIISARSELEYNNFKGRLDNAWQTGEKESEIWKDCPLLKIEDLVWTDIINGDVPDWN